MAARSGWRQKLSIAGGGFSRPSCCLPTHGKKLSFYLQSPCLQHVAGHRVLQERGHRGKSTAHSLPLSATPALQLLYALAMRREVPKKLYCVT